MNCMSRLAFIVVTIPTMGLMIVITKCGKYGSYDDHNEMCLTVTNQLHIKRGCTPRSCNE